jgi:hypothetical protein
MAMRIRSLGYRTDLIFARAHGQVANRGDHLVIRTPSNPGFYWGNFLLSPVRRSKGRWSAFTRRSPRASRRGIWRSGGIRRRASGDTLNRSWTPDSC